MIIGIVHSHAQFLFFGKNIFSIESFKDLFYNR